MSIDWTVVRDECQEYHHLGQDMGGRYSFGYGSMDYDGRRFAGEFITNHIYCGFTGKDLRIVKTDNIPTIYKNTEGQNET